MIGSNIARVDARRLDRIDQAEDLRDLRPAMNARAAASPPGSTCGTGVQGSSRLDGANDVER